MKKELSLEEKIFALKSENELKLKSEIKCLEIQNELFELTGVKFMIVDYGKECKNFGIIAENGSYSGDLFERNSIKNVVEKIEKHLNLKPKLFSYGFAGKDPLPTLLNCSIAIDNNVSEWTWNHSTKARIKFYYEGYSIEFSGNLFSMFNRNDLNNISVVHPKQSHYKNPEYKTTYNIRDYHTIYYSGRNNVSAVIKEADKNDFMELVYFKKNEESQ